MYRACTRPGIVDADLFRTVQARLDQPLVRPIPPHTRYLLSEFIRCTCGGPVSGHELRHRLPLVPLHVHGLAELRARQGRTTALHEEIERVQVTIKTLDAQKHRAVRLFTISEADDDDVKRELGRINKLYLQARSRVAELEGRRAVSVQLEPIAQKSRSTAPWSAIASINGLPGVASGPRSSAGRIHARKGESS